MPTVRRPTSDPITFPVMRFKVRPACAGSRFNRVIRLTGEKACVRAWTHLLRHTYATHTLVTLQRNRERNRIEPVVVVQRQLGHASIQTTMVYLHLVNELADDAVHGRRQPVSGQRHRAHALQRLQQRRNPAPARRLYKGLLDHLKEVLECNDIGEGG